MLHPLAIENDSTQQNKVKCDRMGQQWWPMLYLSRNVPFHLCLIKLRRRGSTPSMMAYECAFLHLFLAISEASVEVALDAFLSYKSKSTPRDMMKLSFWSH